MLMITLNQLNIITVFLFSHSIICSSNSIQFSMQKNNAQCKKIVQNILNEQIQKIEVIHRQENARSVITVQDKIKHKKENPLLKEKQKNRPCAVPDWLQTVEYGAVKNKYAKQQLVQKAPLPYQKTLKES